MAKRAKGKQIGVAVVREAPPIEEASDAEWLRQLAGWFSDPTLRRSRPQDDSELVFSSGMCALIAVRLGDVARAIGGREDGVSSG
jgi:hypothetical protein